MALTKAEAAAKAREAKAAKSKLEARADTEQPSGERDLQAEAEAGYNEANGLPEPPEAKPEVTAYVYVGGLNMVVVVIDGASYDFRAHEPVYLQHPDAGLDKHPDFKRLKA